jgi:Zn-dependent alcohol dehydrogenase
MNFPLTMRAAIFRGPGEPFAVEEVHLDAPRTGEVLVKIAATGVCHSDWHLMTGATNHPVPAVVGHEGSGVVAQLGDGVPNLMVGDHVALNWAPSCGSCFYCRAERPSLCGEYVEPIWAGTMMDGTTRLSQDGRPLFHFSALACFAEYAVVPAQCCVPIPKQVPLDGAALIGCAVTTGVGAVLNTAQVTPDSVVVVIGAGGVGLSIVLGAAYAGAAEIIVLDRTVEKLEIARSLGATRAFLCNEAAVELVRGLTDGRGADYVFEAVGVPELQTLGLEITRPGGTLVLAGISPQGSATNLPGAQITRQEKTIMGCYYGTGDPKRDFPAYADLYLAGKLPLDAMISRPYRLEEINEAYGDMLEGRTARGVVVF